jgi:hypothetical protein
VPVLFDGLSWISPPERSKEEQHTTLKMPTNTHHNYYGTTPTAKLYFHGTKTKTQKMTETRKRNHAHGEVQSAQKCEPEAQEKKWRKKKTLVPQGGEK